MIVLSKHPGTLAQWRTATDVDDYANLIIAQLDKAPAERTNRYRHFTRKDGLLYYNNRLYAPHTLRASILLRYHDQLLTGGHAGEQRTLVKIIDEYYWPRMEKEIFTYVKGCPTCQRHRGASYNFGLLRSLPTPNERWHTVGFDIC